MLLAQQYRWGKTTLFPSFPQHDCSLSPHNTLDTSQGRAHMQGIRALGTTCGQQKGDRKMCKFLLITSIFSPWTLFTLQIKEQKIISQKPEEQRSRDLTRTVLLLPQTPDVAVGWSPSLPDLKMCHTTPQPCVTPMWPLLVLRGSQGTDAPCLSSRETPTTLTLGFGCQRHSLRLALTAAEKEIFPHVSQQCRVFTTCHTNFCSFPPAFPNWCCTEVITEP